jgi:periplasmic protein TonB
MFNDAFLDDRAESRRPWTIAVSFLAQSLAVALAILASLFTATDLPARQWVAHLLAPPPVPPAALPAEPAPVTALREPLQRFEESGLVTPAAIPDEVAVIVDRPETSFSGPRVSGVAPVPGTVPGGTNNVLAHLIAIQEAPPPAPAPQPEPRQRHEPVLVSSDLQAARLIRRVEPVYPALARQARVSGVVRLEAIIGEDGAIRQLRVLSGHPLLIPSARDAVKQWRYRPTLLGGVAVPVLTRIDVHFKLGGQ